MLAQHRRNKILDLVREEGSVRVSALSEIFGVSEVTIRQDLEKLAGNDLVVRDHGGACLKSIPDQVKSLTLQHAENMDKKARIGELAAKLVKPGESIILDSGTTTTEVAKRLIDLEGLNVITNALNIALILGAQPNMTVMVTGGEFKAPTLSLTGDKAAMFFQNVHVDKLFLATAGVSLDAGLTYPGFSDLPVKSAMIKAASTVYLVADSTKIGKKSLANLGSINFVNTLITDGDIRAEDKAGFERRGIEVLTA